MTVGPDPSTQTPPAPAPGLWWLLTGAEVWGTEGLGVVTVEITPVRHLTLSGPGSYSNTSTLCPSCRYSGVLMFSGNSGVLLLVLFSCCLVTGSILSVVLSVV